MPRSEALFPDQSSDPEVALSEPGIKLPSILLEGLRYHLGSRVSAVGLTTQASMPRDRKRGTRADQSFPLSCKTLSPQPYTRCVPYPSSPRRLQRRGRRLCSQADQSTHPQPPGRCSLSPPPCRAGSRCLTEGGGGVTVRVVSEVPL